MRSRSLGDPRSFDSFAVDCDRFTGFEESGLGWLAEVDGFEAPPCCTTCLVSRPRRNT
jgi:hypothetical protein